MFAAASMSAVPENKLRVVATTTLISSIVSEIGKDRVEVMVLVSGKICPGTFDFEPGTMKKIVRSDLFLSHSWERWVDNLFNKLNSNQITKISISADGNWMIPIINEKAAGEIKDILSSRDPANKSYYEKNLRNYVRKLSFLSRNVKKNALRFKNVKVISADKQKDFLEWLGFDIVASFDDNKELTIKDIIYLISKGKKERVVIVADNLQSGPNIGLRIAQEIGAEHVVLSNFPGNSYKTELESNLSRLSRAIK